LFCPLMCAIMLVIVFGSRAGRVFGLGFVLGFVVEFSAMTYCTSHGLLRFSGTSLVPVGWYPVEIPIHRFILVNDVASAEAASVIARFAAFLVSGTLFGALACFAGERVWKLITARHQTEMPVNRNDHIHGSRASVSASKVM